MPSLQETELTRQRQELHFAEVMAASPDGCRHVPSRYTLLAFDDWDPKVGPFGTKVEAAMRAAIDDAASLLITGPIGCGKTAAAAIVCNERARPWNAAYWQAAVELHRVRLELLEAETANYSDPMLEAARKKTAAASKTVERTCPMWVSVPALLSTLRREMGTDSRKGHDLVERAIEAHILVLDDIGATRNTEWAIQTITEIVAQRYDDELQTIVTSNVAPQELADVGLERVISRLAEDGVLLAIGKSAKDHRMTKRRSLE